MGFIKAHGTSQARLSKAKGLAQEILERTHRIEAMWQLSNTGHIEEWFADHVIRNIIDEIEDSLEEYRGHLSYREDTTDSLNQLK